METAAHQLFQTVKDHNNRSIQEMVDVSNTYCYREALYPSSDDEELVNEQFHPTHFPSVPCSLVVVHHGGYFEAFENALRQLESDGLVFGMFLNTNADAVPPGRSSNDVTSTIRKIERVMELCKHALYRGDIYARPNNALLTYVKLMDVSSYLNKLLANDAINDCLVRHFGTIEKILSHPACEIVHQMHFDSNVIEVSKGYCFSISERAFIPSGNAIADCLIGKLSPRAYVPYDCSSPPQPLHFRQGILNSFPDEATRLKFLNKFFQCLLSFKMPQKARKLVVAGPRDSGKTSWANVFHRIIPPEYIASITDERQFSAAMVTDATQLVIIDEWSKNTMNSDLAKTLLQGGWMVTAVKHGQPKCINCYSPFYITTNNVPDFGSENENVRRRIEVFNTTSLPTVRPGIDSWIRDNAMHCIAWIADEINHHRDLIPREELWYENQSVDDDSVVPSNHSSLVQWNRSEIMLINEADLDPVQHQTAQVSNDTIHRGFLEESRSRILARKRRLNRQSRPSESSSEGDVEQREEPSLESEGSSVPPNNENPSTSIDRSRDPQPSPVSLDDRNSTTPDEQQVCGLPKEPSPEIEEPVPPVDDQPSTSISKNQDPRPFQVSTDTPKSGWVLNNNNYMAKVAHHIRYLFSKNIQKGHVHCFTERWRKAKMKRDIHERAFWEKADPELDAWMLATGRRRDVFDLKTFVEQHANILPDLETLRNHINVFVLPSRCPVTQAMKEQSGQGNNTPQLPSQSYWTTIKKWLG